MKGRQSIAQGAARRRTGRATHGGRTRRRLLGLALAAAFAPAAIAGARPAHAAGGQTYVVTTTSDPASCPDPSGLSLRCAVALAEGNSSPDTITFNLPAPSTIFLGRTLTIEPGGGSLTIQGPGARALTLDGHYQVQDLAVAGTVTLADLTVADGLAQGQAGFMSNGGGGGGGAAGLGGGLIVNGGNVTIAGVTFIGDSAEGGAGGLSIPGTPGGLGGFGGGPTGGFGGIGIPIGPGGGPGGPGGFASGGGGGGDSGGDPSTGVPFPIIFPGGFGGFGGFGGGGGGGGASAGAGGTSLGFGGTGGFASGDGGGGGGGGAGLGGAIFVQQGALTVTGSTFKGNSAVGGMGGVPSGSPGLSLGGAIFAYQGSVTTDTCTTFSDGSDTRAIFQATYNDAAPCVTSTQLTGSGTSSTYGQTLTLSARVAVVGSGTPAGSVSFYDGAASLGAAPLDGTGTVTFSTSSLGVGTHSITAVYGSFANDAGSASAPLSVQVTPAPLTIKATDQSMTYGGPVPSFGASYSGLVNSDTGSVVSGLTCGASDANGAPVSSGTPAGTYAIMCSGGSAANYALNYQTGTLTINPAPLTVTADDESLIYGESLPALTASFSGFVNGDGAASLSAAPACATAASSTSPVGSYAINCSGAVDPNYSISYQSGLLTITQAPLTITASSPTVTYNGSVPAITPGYSGFVNGDGAASLSTAPSCASTAPNGGAAGVYPTSCSSASDPNYAISYVGGTLTIEQAAQSIGFGPLSAQTLGAAPITVSATGGASGNTITFTASPASVCTSGGTNGATITLVGAGTCTVTANQAGNQDYLPAPSVAQSFSVSYPPLSLALGLSNSPAGPVSTGSVVTATMTLANHTATAQTVTLKVALTYTSSHGNLSITVPLTLKLNAGQTLSKSASFPIYAWFPRGSYTLSATATDGSGDRASSAATLTVS